MDLMSHLSHVKWMYCQPIHLKHELILRLQITRGCVDFNGDSTVKSLCWRWVSNLWPSDLDLLHFAAVPFLQNLTFFMAPHGPAPFKWPVLWGTALQQSPAHCLEHSRVSLIRSLKAIQLCWDNKANLRKGCLGQDGLNEYNWVKNVVQLLYSTNYLAKCLSQLF